MNILINFILASIIMGILDFVWLRFAAKKIYYNEIGALLLKKPFMPAALLFYVIYVIGIVVFVITPALNNDSWFYATYMGALFGLVAYATYDLTNLATLKGFSAKIVIIDLIWGALLTSIVATGTVVAVGLL